MEPNTDEGYPILEDVAELLYRQVHPSMMHDGQPQTGAFSGWKSPDGRLSTRRQEVSAQGAYEEWTASRDAKGEFRQSDGSWAISVGEIIDGGSYSFDDSADTEPFHASVEFRQFETRGAALKFAGKLRNAAVARERQYPAP